MKSQLLTWGMSIAAFCAIALGIISSPDFNRLRPITEVSGLPRMEQTAEAALRPASVNASQDLTLTDPDVSPDANPGEAAVPTVPRTESVAQSDYQPREVVTLADPSNYGDRYATDAYGRPANQEFIVVLHETVGSASSALNLFRRHHPNDADQVSYHTLIGRDGTIYYVVPPEKRAYGAGNSVFNGPNGPETVTTNPNFASSVNNFAYHVSLETPSDGRGNQRTHSGYTEAQYQSLAWLLARTNIPSSRITTHQAVDRSGSRMDPRSFNSAHFSGLLQRYPSRQGLS